MATLDNNWNTMDGIFKMVYADNLLSIEERFRKLEEQRKIDQFNKEIKEIIDEAKEKE